MGGKRMGICIDGTKAHKVRVLGDLTLIFTWINHERAMVLLPTYRKGTPFFIVMDSAAHKYLDPGHVARQASVACELLGLGAVQAPRVAGLLVDHLDDLVLMPSAPPDELMRSASGEAKVFADGQLMGGAEIHLPQTAGVAHV